MVPIFCPTPAVETACTSTSLTIVLVSVGVVVHATVPKPIKVTSALSLKAEDNMLDPFFLKIQNHSNKAKASVQCCPYSVFVSDIKKRILSRKACAQVISQNLFFGRI